MKEAITEQTWKTLQYRKRQLARKAEQVELLLAGQGQSLLPFLQEDGQLSEEKVKAFTERLMETLELTLRAREQCELTEEQRTFYQDYLYTLLRVAGDPPPWLSLILVNGTFSDLMDMTRDVLKYRDKAHFLLDVAYWQSSDSLLFYCLDLAWETATGENLSQRIDPEELAEAERRFPDQAKAVKEYHELQSVDIEPWMEEEGSEIMEPWMLEAEEAQDAERQAWLERFFQSPDARDAYLRWRDSYFDLRAYEWLEYQMEGMIDVFLYQEGRSSLLTDDTYFSVYALLNRAEKQLRRLLHDRE